MDYNYANQAGLIVWHLISYLWLVCAIKCVSVCVHAHVCGLRMQLSFTKRVCVCVFVCALFWLQGCWCCAIMSSIISPVNTAKSSCPWEKLWKGECQYWQTNKFWQRGATFGQSVKATDTGLQAWAVMPVPDKTWCVFFETWFIRMFF